MARFKNGDVVKVVDKSDGFHNESGVINRVEYNIPYHLVNYKCTDIYCYSVQFIFRAAVVYFWEEQLMGKNIGKFNVGDKVEITGVVKGVITNKEWFGMCGGYWKYTVKSNDLLSHYGRYEECHLELVAAPEPVQIKTIKDFPIGTHVTCDSHNYDEEVAIVIGESNVHKNYAVIEYVMGGTEAIEFSRLNKVKAKKHPFQEVLEDFPYPGGVISYEGDKNRLGFKSPLQNNDVNKFIACFSYQFMKVNTVMTLTEYVSHIDKLCYSYDQKDYIVFWFPTVEYV